MLEENSRKKTLLLVIPIVVVILFLWKTGRIGLWTKGMSFIANNTEVFTDKNGHILEGEYSISIDLSDLESNVGKELYNDGTHRIYVSWIENTGNVNFGGYQIGFRTSGDYTLSGASLVSGIHHATLDDQTFTYYMTAKMTAEYNDQVYNSSVLGKSGLNYKDGDEFAFYIFPSEAYDKNEITLNETDTVRLTVTDLYKNVWSKR